MSTRTLTAIVTPERLYPWLGRLSALLMLALLGWLGATIFWTLNAPESRSPSALMETDAQRAAQSIGNRHLFGQYVSAIGAVAAPSNLKLSGVITAQKPGQRAYALIQIEGKAAQLVKEGDEVAPGITLQRVLARQVEIQRNGQSQTLTLPENSKAAAAPSNAAVAAIASAPPAPGAEPLKVAEAAPASTPAPAATPPAATPATPAAGVTPEPPKAQTLPPATSQSGPPAPRRGRNRRSTEDD